MRRRNGNVSEAGNEQTQVVLVALRPLEREAEANLELRAEAAHAPAADRADGLSGEPFELATLSCGSVRR